MDDEEITPLWMRSIGFRICSVDADNQPHMVWQFDNRMETGIEVSRSIAQHERGGGTRWTCWLRSDIAHSRCRFCYIRTVERRREMLELIRGVSGTTPTESEVDAAQFAESWEREEADCKRRYAEYARGERWGRVPG
ncbi:MAG: hypothetical protein E6Q97_22300 [Desulfurellales bacterium]|nr:MAG: hypothetical protein E6Q97_22300 [Desulfurellales bacterium]